MYIYVYTHILCIYIYIYIYIKSAMIYGYIVDIVTFGNYILYAGSPQKYNGDALDRMDPRSRGGEGSVD